MSHGVEDATTLGRLIERATVLAVGPGLGRGGWGEGMLDACLKSGKPLVIDADGLNWLAAHSPTSGDWVLTPHPGEAARLLECTVAEVQRDRYAAVDALQQRYGGVVLLKGAGTLISDGIGPVGVSTSGNPGMGSGGMGDVLSGVVAGLWAQGLVDGRGAARLGACLHGIAADRAALDGERGLLASDLFPHLRALVNPPA
jgi:NAD(P)H-hydrate epimerase